MPLITTHDGQAWNDVVFLGPEKRCLLLTNPPSSGGMMTAAKLIWQNRTFVARAHYLEANGSRVGEVGFDELVLNVPARDKTPILLALCTAAKRTNPTKTAMVRDVRKWVVELLLSQGGYGRPAARVQEVQVQAQPAKLRIGGGSEAASVPWKGSVGGEEFMAMMRAQRGLVEAPAEAAGRSGGAGTSKRGGPTGLLPPAPCRETGLANFSAAVAVKGHKRTDSSGAQLRREMDESLKASGTLARDTLSMRANSPV